jgi:uncharacterized membrane protein YcaP (DUF421 family)
VSFWDVLRSVFEFVALVLTAVIAFLAQTKEDVIMYRLSIALLVITSFLFLLKVIDAWNNREKNYSAIYPWA